MIDNALCLSLNRPQQGASSGSRRRVSSGGKDEVAALKKLGPKPHGPVFTSERGGSMSENSFFKIVQRAGVRAGLGPHIHTHMLRHSCGYDMVSRGLPFRHIQDWLGHKNIHHTVKYTRLGADRFRKVNMW